MSPTALQNAAVMMMEFDKLFRRSYKRTLCSLIITHINIVEIYWKRKSVTMFYYL